MIPMNTPYPPLLEPERFSARFFKNYINYIIKKRPSDRQDCPYPVSQKGNTDCTVHTMPSRYLSLLIHSIWYLLFHHLGRLMPGTEKIGLGNQVFRQIYGQYYKGKEENKDTGIPFECRQ